MDSSWGSIFVLHVIGYLVDVTGNRVGIRIRHTRIVDVIVEGSVVVPEHVAPFFMIAVGIEAAPPCGVVVNPVGSDESEARDKIVASGLYIEQAHG